MSDEIISGLRNALERGESLDKAAQSFLNAGYNPNEVKESVTAITQGATDITIQPVQHTSTQKESNQTFPKNFIQGAPQAPAETILIQKPKKKHRVLITVLVVVLLILGAVLVSLAVLGNQILAALSGFLK